MKKVVCEKCKLLMRKVDAIIIPRLIKNVPVDFMNDGIMFDQISYALEEVYFCPNCSDGQEIEIWENKYYWDAPAGIEDDIQHCKIGIFNKCYEHI